MKTDVKPNVVIKKESKLPHNVLKTTNRLIVDFSKANKLLPQVFKPIQHFDAGKPTGISWHKKPWEEQDRHEGIEHFKKRTEQAEAVRG